MSASKIRAVTSFPPSCLATCGSRHAWRLRAKQRGQGLTEYIIILSLIALAAIVAVTFFGGTVQQQFRSMSMELMGDNGSQEIKQRSGQVSTVVVGQSTLQSYGNTGSDSGSGAGGGGD